MTPTRRFCVVSATLTFGGLLSFLYMGYAAEEVQRAAAVKKLPNGTTDPKEPTFSNAIIFPKDRRAQEIMNKGAELIAEKEWAKAVRELQFLLNRPEDGFVQVADDTHGDPALPTSKSAAWASIRAEASRLIGTMPREGVEIYERLYGGEATRMLEESQKGSDLSAVAEVAQRYLHTQAGARAAELLGTRCLERDEPLMAALYFESLLTRPHAEVKGPILLKAALASYLAGDKAGGDLYWRQLKDKAQRDGGINVDGQLVSLDQLRSELDKTSVIETAQVREWAMYRGAPNRTAQGIGGIPYLEAGWERSTLPQPAVDPSNQRNLDIAQKWVQGFLTEGSRYAEQRQQPIIPAFQPIAVGNKIIYRSYDGIFVADLKNPTMPEWWSYTDGGAFSLMNDSAEKTQVDQWTINYIGQPPQGWGPRTILFDNSVIGTLSTDGVRAFAVDDLVLPPHPQVMRSYGGQPSFNKINELVNRNTLKCFNIESGKLMWELGGQRDKSDLVDSFFLGPPLPLGGRLYLLNEKDTVLRLVCLEPKDTVADKQPPQPTIVWTQTLATTKDRIQLDFNRRIHAAHLSYSDGILVCPTNAGAILGVNLLTHSLVWAHSYREGVDPKAAGKNPAEGAMPMSSLSNEWKVSAPAIQDGKVVFTAPDGTAVHCINLRDGRLVWRTSRGADDCYLAGIFHGKALIVSKNSVRALGLNNGKEVWRLDNTGMPSGQGAASDNVYFLPVRASAETKQPGICSIDVDKGVILAHTKSRQRDGKLEVPGNLFFHEGQVVSQSIDRIVTYPQLKVKLAAIDKLLVQNPADADSLVERGELRLDQGEHPGAITDLHAALRIVAGNPGKDALATKARGKLYDAFTEFLQKDFNQAERHLDEYRDLCRSDNADEDLRRQGNFLCLLAKGRENQGRLVDAFQAYRDFSKLTRQRELISVIDQPNTKSQPLVWARGRINAMLARATVEQRRPLDDKVAEEWKSLQDGSDLNALREFVSLFGSAFTVGKQAKLHLADKLITENKEEGLCEAQTLLLQLRELRSTEPELAAKAVDGLARLNLQKGILEHAVHYFQELGRDFGTVVVRDGKTGADIWNELATDRRFLPFLEGARQSWNGKWKATEEATATLASQAITLEPVGELLPYFQRHRLVLETSTQRLRLIDQSTGADKLPTGTILSADVVRSMAGQQNLRVSYQVQGTIAVLNLGSMCYGFDLVDKKKLWEYNLLNGPVSGGMVMRDPRDGSLVLVYQDGFLQRIGQVGPVEASYVCIQTRDGLVALDPLKGNVLWTKTGISPRTRIFGDSQYIFLVDVNAEGQASSGARAVRAEDGTTVAVPDFTDVYQHKLRVVGRSILAKEETPQGDLVLRLYDAYAGKDLWKKTLPRNSILLKADDPNLAGAIEPDGNVTLLDVRAQRELPHFSLDWKEVLGGRGTDISRVLERVVDAHILADRDHLYVALCKPTENACLPNAHMMRSIPVNGMVYAFDRTTGQPRWAGEVQNQMLVLEQFATVPVLLFTTQFNERNNLQQFRVQTIQTINKQNGRLLFDKKIPNNSNQFHAIHLDARNGTVELLHWNFKVRHQLESH